MPEIPKENSFGSGTRNSAVIDGRITGDKLSFTIKWEKHFTCAYYRSYHVVGPVKLYSDLHDQIGKQFQEPTICIKKLLANRTLFAR